MRSDLHQLLKKLQLLEKHISREDKYRAAKEAASIKAHLKKLIAIEAKKSTS